MDALEDDVHDIEYLRLFDSPVENRSRRKRRKVKPSNRDEKGRLITPEAPQSSVEAPKDVEEVSNPTMISSSPLESSPLVLSNTRKGALKCGNMAAPSTAPLETL